jgi:hypothetical protein
MTHGAVRLWLRLEGLAALSVSLGLGFYAPDLEDSSPVRARRGTRAGRQRRGEEGAQPGMIARGFRPWLIRAMSSGSRISLPFRALGSIRSRVIPALSACGRLEREIASVIQVVDDAGMRGLPTEPLSRQRTRRRHVPPDEHSKPTKMRTRLRR